MKRVTSLALSPSIPCLMASSWRRVPEGEMSGSLWLDIPKVHIPLGQLSDNDLPQSLHPASVVDGEEDRAGLGIDRDGGGCAFEIKAGGQFLQGLVHGVFHLHAVHFRDNVK